MKQKLHLKLLSLYLLLTISITNAQTFIIDGLLYTVTSGKNVSVQNASSYGLSITGDLIIPSTVTNSNINYKVTSIGNSGFYNNGGLTSVIIPDSVTIIGEYAFYQCGLTSFIFPNSLTTIGDGAFEGCGFLTSVNIPKTVTSIGDYAFSGTALTSITLPNSITTIGDGIFKGCSLLTSIILPNSLTTIGKYAFSDCLKLTSIILPNSVTSIGAQAFIRCTGLTSIILPNSLTNIGNSAFFSCTGITSVIIPDSVTSIPWGAFSDCTGLKSVILPKSVTSIGVYAFSGCSGLTTVIIPNSVTSIGEFAFEYCFGLTSIIVSWPTPLSINSNVFDRLKLGTIALVVSSLGIVSDYQTANVWKDFSPIGTVLSTEKYLLNNNLRIYPNPTKDFISVSGLTKSENYIIYTILGAKVNNGSVSNNEKIATQNLTNGLYFIKLEDGNTIKFIKE